MPPQTALRREVHQFHRRGRTEHAVQFVDSAQQAQGSVQARLFLFIGVLGSFTTFSTFAYETLALTQQADFLRASVNVVIQVLFCLACVWLGFAVSRLL